MRGLFKKIIAMFICALIISSPSLSYAESLNEKGTKEYSKDIVEVDSKDVVEVDSSNIESISKAIGIPKERISSVKVYYDPNLKLEFNIQPMYLGNCRITSGPREAWGTNPIAKTYATGGSGGSNFSKTYTQTVSFSQSNTIGLSAGEVSAELGFGSGTEYSVTDTFSSDIPANSSGYLYVYPIYDSYDFSIYNVWGSYVGSGNALRPIGLGFITSW